MKTFLHDALLSIVVGALLFLAPGACEPDTVPSPVGVVESAVSGVSSGSGCAETDFQCCQTWVEPPTCKDGQLTCRDGWITCGAEDGDQ